jgi:UDP-N-acetyl-D-glucosamine dehydrogenase
MPYFVVENIVEAMSQRGKPPRVASILVLGMAYKRDIDDLRESPSLTIIELLQKRGAHVEYNDPSFPPSAADASTPSI